MATRWLVVGFVLLIGWPVGSPEWSRNMTVNFKNTKLFVSWNVDWQLQQVEIDVRYSNRRPTWILIGFSDHGKVEGSDGCLYTGDQRVLDVHLLPSGKIKSDRHQDCRIQRANPKNMHFRFVRKFSTCDPRDYAVEMGTTNFIFAVGHSKKLSMRVEHAEHVIRENSLLDPLVLPPPTPPENHYFVMDITTQDVLVPAIVTTYWCQVMRMDVRLQTRKHHTIRYEAIITPGNEHLVHHMEIFHCRSDPGESYGGPCDGPRKPKAARTCSQVLAAWAMGAQPVVYPPEAGMPLGGEDFVPYLMVEVHYNNVHRESNVRDSSGFRIGYTDQLRPYDAGIIELGLIYSDANSIPPGQPNFPITGQCVPECTRHFPPSGIKIFATQLHAHLTGRKLFTSHFRNGVKIGEINRDNHYSPHWQVVRSLPVHAHVLPGDVLSTTCVYDTRERSNWTWGGYEIESEMCVNYIHFYPSANVEVCKSAISNRTLDRFFRNSGEKQQRHLIHERYLALPKAQQTYDELHEWYATEALNMACLDHSGQLIQDSTVDWEHVQRPEVFAGVYDRSGARAECPAIND